MAPPIQLLCSDTGLVRLIPICEQMHFTPKAWADQCGGTSSNDSSHTENSCTGKKDTGYLFSPNPPSSFLGSVSFSRWIGLFLHSCPGCAFHTQMYPGSLCSHSRSAKEGAQKLMDKIWGTAKEVPCAMLRNMGHLLKKKMQWGGTLWRLKNNSKLTPYGQCQHPYNWCHSRFDLGSHLLSPPLHCI